jgi:uncharacterized short protein YbdD (DUF466 family)
LDCGGKPPHSKGEMKNRLTTIVISALMLAPSSSFAQWGTGKEKLKDEPWRKYKGTFGAMLLLVPDYRKFLDDWKKPKPPAIVVTRTAERNKPLTAAVLFTGCTRKNGNCNIEVDFTVVRPDGSTMGAANNTPAWKNKRGAPPGVLQISDAALGVRIEPQDPAGIYLVKARVRDLNASTSLDLVQPLTVAK